MATQWRNGSYDCKQMLLFKILSAASCWVNGKKIVFQVFQDRSFAKNWSERGEGREGREKWQKALACTRSRVGRAFLFRRGTLLLLLFSNRWWTEDKRGGEREREGRGREREIERERGRGFPLRTLCSTALPPLIVRSRPPAGCCRLLQRNAPRKSLCSRAPSPPHA